MGIKANLDARRAMIAHSRGDMEKAQALYEDAYKGGNNQARVLLSYAILLLRSGQYEKAAEILRKAEKAPDLKPDQRVQMLTHYAVTVWKLGRLDYAIELLEEVFRKGKTSNIYGTLGYVLIEKGDFERAEALNKEAVEYDDEDAIALDNLGQTYYRLSDRKDEAKKWFEKAYEVKPEQIDTNYFLAQYDIAAGDIDAARKKLTVSKNGRFSPLNYATPEMVEAQLAELGGPLEDAPKEEA